MSIDRTDIAVRILSVAVAAGLMAAFYLILTEIPGYLEPRTQSADDTTLYGLVAAALLFCVFAPMVATCLHRATRPKRAS